MRERDKRNKEVTLSSAFLIMACIFAAVSFLGVYSYKIYDTFYFGLFFALELIFGLGLKSGNLVVRTHEKKNNKYFYITKHGQFFLVMMMIISLGCFAYFIILYAKTGLLSAVGTYTGDIYQQNYRNSLEKFTLLLMQICGEIPFLVYSASTKKAAKWIRVLSVLCFTLVGIRALLLGTRFAIAAEFIVIVAAYFDQIRKASETAMARLKSSWKARLAIILAAVVLGAFFMHLFKTRTYYTAFQRYQFHNGDMAVRPLWAKLYYATNGAVNPLYTLSDYMGEAPYIFSYACKYCIPQKRYWGVYMFRSVVQILNNLGIGNSYQTMIDDIFGGQYTGFGYELIVDFGIYLTPLITYLIGLLFSKIERYRETKPLCAALYPVVFAMCVFAPIFYFNVGRMDYIFVFSVFLVPLFLKEGYVGETEKE